MARSITPGPLSDQANFMRMEMEAIGVPVKYAGVRPDPRGYFFPYWHAKGFGRIKLMPALALAAERKYDQPPGESHIYFSPHFSPFKPIVILTEGEKKALCAAYHWKAPVMGIGGKDNWHNMGNHGLHKELAKVIDEMVPGARLIIVPDGDIHTRLDIKQSYGSLVYAIHKRRADLAVFVKSLPKQEPRLGLDDWICQEKGSFRKMKELLSLPDLTDLPRLKSELLAGAEYAYSTNAQGVKTLLATEYNLIVYASNAYDFRLDSTLGPIELLPAGHRKITDAIVIGVAKDAQRDLKVKFTLQQARNAVMFITHNSLSNIMGDYMRGLQWDGRERVNALFTRYIKAGPGHAPAYLAGVARGFLTGLVARACQPGIKYDFMLVLVGAQGIMKSTVLSVLAGGDDYYAEVTHVNSVNDLMRAGADALVVDVSELHSYNKLEITQVKSWLSARVDTFVDKYDKHATHRPKGYVVVGTTNEQGFLRDPTGERRYWPIRVASIDIEAVERDRDQLLAEAMMLWQAGGIQWDVPGVEQEQKGHKVVNPWRDDLEQLVAGALEQNMLPTYQRKPILTMQWVLKNLAHKHPRIDRFTRQVASDLRSMGWDDNDGMKRNSVDIRFRNNSLQPSEFFTLTDGKMPRQVRFWMLMTTSSSATA